MSMGVRTAITVVQSQHSHRRAGTKFLDRCTIFPTRTLLRPHDVGLTAYVSHLSWYTHLFEQIKRLLEHSLSVFKPGTRSLSEERNPDNSQGIFECGLPAMGPATRILIELAERR